MKTFTKIFVLTILSVSIGLPLFSESGKEDIAYINFITGKAQVKSGDLKETRELKLNDRINSGDLITTEAGSKVTVLYKGSEFKISPNASVLIRDLFGKNKPGHVDVNNGFAWFKLVKFKGYRLNVTTPASTAGVRGTAFATLYDPELKQAMNCVCEGKVEIQSTVKDSKPVTVNKGNGSAIDLGMKDVAKADYKDEIEKGSKGLPGKSLPQFENRIQKAPLMKSCITCHAPKGWTPKEEKVPEPSDSVY